MTSVDKSTLVLETDASSYYSLSLPPNGIYFENEKVNKSSTGRKVLIMALIEIDKIELHRNAKIDFELTLPVAGHSEDVYSLQMEGRVKAKKFNSYCKLINIRDKFSGNPSSFPLPHSNDKTPWNKPQNFKISTSLVGSSLEFQLDVLIIMNDDTNIKVATIFGTRQPVRSSYLPSLQPLMITSLGRTGTTMLMQLLSAHPSIVVQKSHPYEVHAGSYWSQFLKVLSAPYPEHEDDVPNIQHLLSSMTPNLSFINRYMNTPQVKNWAGVKYTESLAAFIQQSLDGYYLSVAAGQGQNPPLFFAEKYFPSFIPWILWELYSGAKEIILVRDFRDMLASINAFNAKRKFMGFSRSKFNTDEEYIKRLGGVDINRLHRAWRNRRDKVYLVRYEDIILKPVETIQSMLQYLELDSSDHAIQMMLSTLNDENENREAHKTSESPKDSIGRWKKDLTPSLQALCNKEFGFVLEEFGYKD